VRKQSPEAIETCFWKVSNSVDRIANVKQPDFFNSRFEIFDTNSH